MSSQNPLQLSASDERILGSSEFVQSPLDGVNEREKETLRLSASILKYGYVFSGPKPVIAPSALSPEAINSSPNL